MNTAVISEILLRRVRLPLHTPYRLSYRTFEDFEPIIVVVRDDNGRSGFGEGHISPGSSSETRAGGWAFCNRWARTLVGIGVAEAQARLAEAIGASPVAATALGTALEMLSGHPLLAVPEEVRLRLLTPFNSVAPSAIAAEVEERLGQGFTTFKIKVGKDVDTDLARVGTIQRAAAGRATLRIDANRAWDRDAACRFAAALDPQSIELFEQPCASDDWAANAAVARVATVPVMLDESICSEADIDRAAAIAGVGFCKLKLKRFGGVARLHRALEHVHEAGMVAVLGDGLSSEPGCWMEACVARTTIGTAGEFNGFLKPRARLFQRPLLFEAGELVLQPGTPRLHEQRLAEATIELQSHRV